jgi:hypothetical protein
MKITMNILIIILASGISFSQASRVETTKGTAIELGEGTNITVDSVSMNGVFSGKGAIKNRKSQKNSDKIESSENLRARDTIQSDKPKEFNMSQNYPNPSNPKSIINFEIPNTSLVTIKVYDVLGKEIAKLVDESKEAGYYSVVFDGTGFSSGVYFYRIEAKDASDSKSFTKIMKMILVK